MMKEDHHGGEPTESVESSKPATLAPVDAGVSA
jgi:hypothetical protein